MRLLAWFVAVAVLLLAGWWAWGPAWEGRFTMAGTVSFLEGSGAWAWLAGLGLLVADLLLPVPGTVVMSGLGWIYGAFGGGLLAALGSMLSGLVGYGVGWLAGERRARRWLGERDFERGRRLFAGGGAWMVAVSRALPILPEALACTAGLVRMPLARFVPALACGALPVGFVFAAVGAAGREAPGWTLALSVGLPAVLWLLARPWLRTARNGSRPDRGGD